MTDSTQTQPAQADMIFLPGPVLLLGAPGVGKGTQAQALMAEFAIPQISTGDLLRSYKDSGTELGLKVKGLLARGVLVDDETVQGMVADRLTTQNDVLHGFILDGFPRTLGQAGWLDSFLGGLRNGAAGTRFAGQGIALPVVAIHITVAYDELLHRITGRRTCPVCKTIYNIHSNPPAVPNVCDIEGAALIQRADDSEAVFTERMKTFEAQTSPVIDYYSGQGRFEAVDGNLPMAAVTANIIAVLRQLRSIRVL